MRLSRSVLLYLALGLGAIAAALFFALGGTSSVSSETAARDYSALAASLEGDMKKLSFHAKPKPVSAKAFIAEDGSEAHLADFRGKHVLLNFWATWCAPCRKEMPMLAELQSEFGGDAFEVVTLATGPNNPPPAIIAFFEEIGVTNLPMHRDPKQQISREMGVLGLPITVILDPAGREIARLQGDAHWSDANAKALIEGLLAPAG